MSININVKQKQNCVSQMMQYFRMQWPIAFRWSILDILTYEEILKI